MTRSIRSLCTVLLILITAASTATPRSPAQATSGDAAPTTADDNVAIAVNTQDGTVEFDFAFSVRRDADGIVDETNVAAALASCTGCTTVALAFQAVLVTRDVDVLIPQNVAIAFNDQCAACFTYASATQLVIGFNGPVRITRAGRERLHDLRNELRELETQAAELTPSQLVAAAEAAELELFAIMAQEVVAVGRRPSRGGNGNRSSEDVTTTSLAVDTPGPTSATSTTLEPTSSPTDEVTTTTSSVAPTSTDSPASTSESTTTTNESPAPTESTPHPTAPFDPTHAARSDSPTTSSP